MCNKNGKKRDKRTWSASRADENWKHWCYCPVLRSDACVRLSFVCCFHHCLVKSIHFCLHVYMIPRFTTFAKRCARFLALSASATERAVDGASVCVPRDRIRPERMCSCCALPLDSICVMHSDILSSVWQCNAEIIAYTYLWLAPTQSATIFRAEVRKLSSPPRRLCVSVLLPRICISHRARTHTHEHSLERAHGQRWALQTLSIRNCQPKSLLIRWL